MRIVFTAFAYFGMAATALAQVASNTPSVVVPVEISGGTLVGQALMWTALVLGPPLAALLMRWLVVIANKFGVQINDSHRARLQEFIENGIALAAKNANAKLDGTMPLAIRNQVVAQAIEYAQAHGADTLKALGADPNDPKTIEALQARAASALNLMAPQETVS